MPRSTEKGNAPPGYMTPKAAAEILGRSDQTIRNLVKEDKVEGTSAMTENGERRYYIAREAVDELAERNPELLDGPPSHVPEHGAPTLPERIDAAERYVDALETHNEALLSLLAEMREQSAKTAERLTRMHEETRELDIHERRLLRLTFLALVVVLLLVGLVRTILYVTAGV